MYGVFNCSAIPDQLEDSSDIEDEESDDGEDTSVLCGFQIAMKPSEDQAYKLVFQISCFSV